MTENEQVAVFEMMSKIRQRISLQDKELSLKSIIYYMSLIENKDLYNICKIFGNSQITYISNKYEVDRSRLRRLVIKALKKELEKED